MVSVSTICSVKALIRGPRSITLFTCRRVDVAAAACVSLAAVADGIVLAAAAGVRAHAGGHPQSLGRGLRRCRRSRSRQT